MIIGTAGTEWKMSAHSATITASSVDIKVQSHWGTSFICPMVVGDGVLFVQYGSKIIRDLQYSLEADGYRGNDLTIFAPHLFEDYTVACWSYQRSPNNIVWVIRSDGKLLGLTYLKEHDVWGWHLHETDGEYETLATVPDGNGNDVTYTIVKRTIGGVTARYVERFVERLEDSDLDNAFFVDSGLSLDNTGSDVLDEFDSDTEQDFTSGGDGAKSYGWNALNTANATSSTAYTDTAGELETVMGAGSYLWLVPTIGQTVTLDTGLFLYQEMTGDFRATTKIEVNTTNNLDGGGLLVQSPSDLTDWIQNAFRKYLTGGTNYRKYFGQVTDDVSTDTNIDTSSVTTNYQWLRIQRKGDVFLLYHSTDGVDFNKLIEYERTDMPNTVRVGVTSGGNTAQINYTYFQIDKLSSTVYGLDHLNGKTINGLFDGNVATGLTVSNGETTLPEPASKGHSGIPYTSDLETLDFVADTQEGTTSGKPSRIVSVIATLKDTRALKIGPNFTDLTTVYFREDELYDTPIGLYTGIKETEILPGDGRSSHVCVRMTDPLPITVSSLQARVEVGMH
jgi:regulation of enolase protein 1 (concanavalin A-like superfamily)